MRKQDAKRGDSTSRERILESCLAEFIRAGTLDLSLDDLGREVGVSKRMLIHYFGGKEALEEAAMLRLEERLRDRFRADLFPPGTPLPHVVAALWEQTTQPASRGVLLLVMDVTRRAWSGSERGRAFYMEQQRLWVELLREFSPDRALLERVLQLFQGAMLAYLITGDRERGGRALREFFATRD